MPELPQNRTKRLLRWAAILGSLVATVYLAASVYAAYSITHPVRWPPHTTPAAYGMTYEAVRFSSVPDGVPLSGWFIDSPGTRTLLVLHGQSSAKDNYINMEVGRRLYQHGFDLLMFDFRAHGESGGDTGSIGEWETRDIAGALTYLEGRGISEVGAIGWSMGAATLLNASPAYPQIKAIVADSAFADLMTVVGGERARMGAPGWLDPGIVMVSNILFGTHLEANRPVESAGKLGERPLLVIHATGDPLIPESQAEKIAVAGEANPNVELWIVKAPGHVAAFSAGEQLYTDKVIHFFDFALGP